MHAADASMTSGGVHDMHGGPGLMSGTRGLGSHLLVLQHFSMFTLHQASAQTIRFTNMMPDCSQLVAHHTENDLQ